MQTTRAPPPPSSPTCSSPADNNNNNDDEPRLAATAAEAVRLPLSRKERNQLSARQSRQRRTAYVLRLELELRTARLHIQRLEAELRAARAESIFSEGRAAAVVVAADQLSTSAMMMLDPADMGIYDPLVL